MSECPQAHLNGENLCAVCGQAEYAGYIITYSPKPIPSRAFDYDFVHPDYDGPGDTRCGNASSILACKQRIDEINDELDINP